MKFSVITTCLNAEKYIKETIDSIFAQKGDFEIEYIVTDAGSKDKTLEIVRSYGDKVKLIDATGTNQSEGFNLGIANATGDVISFINGDDTYEPGAFAKVTEAYFKQPHSDWFVGKCRIVNETGTEIDRWISSYKNFWLSHYSYFWLLVENFVPHPSTFIKKELFDKYGQYNKNLRYTMDYDLWLRIGKNHKPFFVKEVLANFRREPGTKSNSGYLKQMKEDRSLGFTYARIHKYFLTIPLKLLSYLRTILIYRFLY